jgi:hypothetical protein
MSEFTGWKPMLRSKTDFDSRFFDSTGRAARRTKTSIVRLRWNAAIDIGGDRSSLTRIQTPRRANNETR